MIARILRPQIVLPAVPYLRPVQRVITHLTLTNRLSHSHLIKPTVIASAPSTTLSRAVKIQLVTGSQVLFGKKFHSTLRVPVTINPGIVFRPSPKYLTYSHRLSRRPNSMFIERSAVEGLHIKVGTISPANSSGNESFTGIGFQPIAVFLWCSTTSTTADTYAASARLSMGAATSPSQRFYHAAWMDGNVSPSNCQRDSGSTKCLHNVDASADLDLVSFDTDGFTFNKSASWGTCPVNYIALRGISAAKAGSFNLATSTGAQTVTDPGFKPDVVLFTWGRNGTGSQADNGAIGIGATDGVNQWANNVAWQDNSTSHDDAVAWSTDGCIQGGTQVAQEFKASITSFDNNGFTLNVSDAADAGSTLIGYLALKDVRANVGSDSQKTTTGTQAKTGIGFTPKMLLFAGTQQTTTGYTTAVDGDAMVGATDASANKAIWIGDVRTKNNTWSSRWLASAKTVVHRHDTGTGSASTDAEASLSSLDADGYTLNWSTADGTARQFGYLALGDLS